MLLAESIEIDAKISERLLYNLGHYFMPLYKMIVPTLSPVSITAVRGTHRLVSYGTCGVATGFSGGVDSFSVVAEHFRNATSPSYQISTLLFNNVGAVPSHLFLEKYDQHLIVAKKLGLDLIPIDSNLATLIQVKFELSHALRNTACALLLQGLYNKYLYASAYSYTETRVQPSENLAFADPLVLPLLSTENLEIIPAGGQHTRVEKTALVANFSYSHQWLNVCVAANRIDNCSVCGKCGRTLLTLEFIGRIEDYREVFDLHKWKTSRSWYIAEYVLNTKKYYDPLSAEIRDFADKVGHKFSGKERLMAVVAAYTTQNILNRLKRWL
jgi:hypothetical protein